MILPRTPVVAALVASAALAVAAPTAGASAWPTNPFMFASPMAQPITGLGFPGGLPVGVGAFPGDGGAAGACITSTNGQGRANGGTAQACVAGGGLSFIGPASNVESVIGPTIITPAFVGTSIVAGGSVAIG